MPELDAPRPDETSSQPETSKVEPVTSTLDDDAAYVRAAFQESYLKNNPDYSTETGNRLIVESLELTNSLLKKYKDEPNSQSVLQKARQELESGTDHRIANNVSTKPNDENLLTLIDLVIDQTPGGLLFDLATNKDTQDITDFTEILSSVYKTRDVKPISDDQLPTLIKTCARQKLLTAIGQEFYDRLAVFEKRRANAPQAFAELSRTSSEVTQPPA